MKINLIFRKTAEKLQTLKKSTNFRYKIICTPIHNEINHNVFSIFFSVDKKCMINFISQNFARAQ